MTRFDQVVEQEKQKVDQAKAIEAERKNLSEEMKRRYTESFKKAIPQFYQTLLKNDLWSKEDYKKNILFFSIKQHKEVVWFTYHDNDGDIFRTKYCIDKSGKYLEVIKSWTGNVVLGFTEIDIDTLADKLFSTNYDYCSSERMATIRKTDTDEVVFQKLAQAIRYANKYRN